MRQVTASPSTVEQQDSRPPDIQTMRDSARLLLGEDAGPLTPGKLDTLTSAMRGHMELLIPEVAAAADRLSEDDIPRYCALACIGEARGKLRAEPLAGHDIAHAQKLARSLNALCDHYENLGGAQSGAGR